MTVSELIRQLNNFPSDMEVVLGEDWQVIYSVIEEDNDDTQDTVVVID